MAGGIDPNFQADLDHFFAAAPGSVSVVSGYRTEEEQAKLYAEKGPGLAAKPGTSWHEKGLAADLRFASPDVLNWAHQHAAEYGLFFPMSWEPWHVQPLWTANRSSSSVADPGAGTSVMPLGAQPSASPDAMGQLLGNTAALVQGQNPSQYPAQQASIGDQWAHVTGQWGAGIGGQHDPTAAGTGATASKLGYKQAYDLIVAAGGTPGEARVLAAIAGPESGYDTGAHNGNAGTGDNSYGLWQVNMLGQVGSDRARTWGLSSYDDLYNPDTNARAALYLYRTQGPSAWTAYKDGQYRQFLPTAS